MDSNTTNIIPSEDIKISFTKISLTTVENKRNPLIHNKGFAKFSGKKPLLQKVKSENTNLIKKEFDCEKKRLEKTKSEIIKNADDDLLSNLSEMNSTERFKKLCCNFQLPLFEVHCTIRDVVDNNEKDIKEENLPKNKPNHIEKFKRMWTMEGKRRIDAEDMTKGLDEKQSKYFTIMNDFKDNYMAYALKCKEIYYQYSHRFKQNMEFLKTEEFKKLREQILIHREKFAQNIHMYHSMI